MSLTTPIQEKEFPYDVSDIILYMLDKVGGKIRSRTRLEKLLYLASVKEPALGVTFDIQDAGPASSLVRRKLIALTAGEVYESFPYTDSSHAIWTHEYKLSALGKMTAKGAAERIPDSVKKAIDSTLDEYGNKSKTELMRIATELFCHSAHSLL